MTNSGLSERDIKLIKDIFDKYPSVILVHIFGSRAKGTFKNGSDIDLAIMNAGVSIDELTRIKGDFEESSLPYLADIIDYTTLDHKEMKEHIERVGVEFYKKTK